MSLHSRIAALALGLVLSASVQAQTPYWTNGVPAATPPLTGVERVPADTYASTGLQQEGISVGQVQGYVNSTPGTWTALQKYTSGDLVVLGASTGYDDFTLAYSGTSHFALALPGYAGGVVVTGTSSPAQGDLLYFNGTEWIDLAPGTSGNCLQTQGASANPLWAGCGSSGLTVGTTVISGGTSGYILYNNAGVLGNLQPVGSGTLIPLQSASSTSWVPADGSGAGLTFASISAASTQIGNMVFAYGQWTYPSTISPSAASFSGLPVAIPNQGYAQQCSLSYTNAAGSVLTFVVPVKTSHGAQFFNSSGVATTNAQLSGAIVVVNCIYPSL